MNARLSKDTKARVLDIYDVAVRKSKKDELNSIKRHRECMGGVGRFCREREQTVTERQRALDAAVGSVEQAVDPQTEAASKVVAWLSAGNANPTAGDFAMLRLLLLSLLPQVGGLLLMIGRTR